MQKFIRAAKSAAAAVLCAVGVASLSGCENYGKMLRDAPDEYIETAMENTMESIGGKTFTEERKLLEQALEDGSFSLGFEAEGITFNGVCKVNEKSNAVSQMYTLSNAEGNSAQVYVYADKDGFKFGTIGDSGSHIYDVTLESLAEKLAASIFAPGSGSAYELSEEEYNVLVEYAEMLSAAMNEADSKDGDKYQKVIDDFVRDLSPMTVEGADVDIGGETVKTNTVTYTVGTGEVKALLNQILDLLIEDGQFDPETTGYSEEEFRAQLDEAMAGLENFSITAVYDVNAKTHVLMQSDITLNITAEGETVDIKLNSLYGADPASSEKQTHTFSMTADGETLDVIMDVTHTETSTVVTANMVNSEVGNTELFTITANKDGENYSLSADIMGTVTAGMEGTISTSSTAFNMTIDRVFANAGSGELSYSPKAKVNVKKGGEIDLLDAEGEFLDITEEEMDALGESVANDFGTILDQATGGALSGYVEKSKIAQANAYAKMVHTSCMAYITQQYVDGNEISGVIEGVGTDIAIGGTDADMVNYLGEDFTGYVYGYADGDSFAVEYVLWSADPIPEKYRYQLTDSEQESLADEGIIIGCYPAVRQ